MVGGEGGPRPKAPERPRPTAQGSFLHRLLAWPAAGPMWRLPQVSSILEGAPLEPDSDERLGSVLC